jgi:hypothetical protein
MPKLPQISWAAPTERRDDVVLSPAYSADAALAKLPLAVAVRAAMGKPSEFDKMPLWKRALLLHRPASLVPKHRRHLTRVEPKWLLEMRAKAAAIRRELGVEVDFKA